MSYPLTSISERLQSKLESLILELCHLGKTEGLIAKKAIERAIAIVAMFDVCDIESYDEACEKVDKSTQEQYYAQGYKDGSVARRGIRARTIRIESRSMEDRIIEP
jgi:hypothetical protein